MTKKNEIHYKELSEFMLKYYNHPYKHIILLKFTTPISQYTDLEIHFLLGIKYFIGKNLKKSKKEFLEAEKQIKKEREHLYYKQCYVDFFLAEIFYLEEVKGFKEKTLKKDKAFYECFHKNHVEYIKKLNMIYFNKKLDYGYEYLVNYKLIYHSQYTDERYKIISGMKSDRTLEKQDYYQLWQLFFDDFQIVMLHQYLGYQGVAQTQLNLLLNLHKKGFLYGKCLYIQAYLKYSNGFGHEKSVESLEEAEKYLPNYPKIYYLYSQIYDSDIDYQKKMLQKIVKIDAFCPRVYYDIQNRIDGVKSYKKCHQLDPHGIFIINKIQQQKTISCKYTKIQKENQINTIFELYPNSELSYQTLICLYFDKKCDIQAMKTIFRQRHYSVYDKFDQIIRKFHKQKQLHRMVSFMQKCIELNEKFLKSQDQYCQYLACLIKIHTLEENYKVLEGLLKEQVGLSKSHLCDDTLKDLLKNKELRKNVVFILYEKEKEHYLSFRNKNFLNYIENYGGLIKQENKTSNRLLYQNFMLQQSQLWKKLFRKDINLEISEFLVKKSELKKKASYWCHYY